MKGKHTVLCVIEAKPGKELELREALIAVIEPSRQEKTCLEYRLHQDINNPSQFILYENWQDKEAHKEQFTKSYILDLSKKITNLIAKPYQVYFADEISV